MGRLRRRIATPRPEPRPWTPEEDARLDEICAIGLSSDFWHLALPGRTVGEITDRRLDRRLKPAPLI